MISALAIRNYPKCLEHLTGGLKMNCN